MSGSGGRASGLKLPNVGTFIGVPRLDRFLNSLTMYRLVLYGLGVICAAAFGLALIGELGYTLPELLLPLGILLVVCQAVNYAVAALVNAPRNIESAYITALILFLILAPTAEMERLAVTAGVGAVAMAAKYLLAYKRKHIFNPVAIALVIMNVAGFSYAFWWVGSEYLLPVVAVVGLLIVRKIRRFHMVGTFIAVALVTIFIVYGSGELSPAARLQEVIASWPLIFFGTIMLTEPLTTPPTRHLRILYGALVGVLFGLKFDFGIIYATPHLALALGNIFSYVVSYKQRLRLIFTEKHKLTPDVTEYVFTPSEPLCFSAGQYLEWTLPHGHADGRGNRRYFTVASSPTEKEVRLAVRLDHTRSSSFKSALDHLKPGSSLYASQLAGDFTLPKDSAEKLVFVAGGIGVTPFRSIFKYLADKEEKRDIVLYYTSLKPDGYAYKDFLDETAEKVGASIQYVLTDHDAVPRSWNGKIGYLDAEMIKRDMPDYDTRTYYLSGPNAMVDAYKVMLTAIGIPRRQIVTDYFPGF